jgi:chromosome segregation ATPase
MLQRSFVSKDITLAKQVKVAFEKKVREYREILKALNIDKNKIEREIFDEENQLLTTGNEINQLYGKLQNINDEVAAKEEHLRDLIVDKQERLNEELDEKYKEVAEKYEHIIRKKAFECAVKDSYESRAGAIAKQFFEDCKNNSVQYVRDFYYKVEDVGVKRCPYDELHNRPENEKHATKFEKEVLAEVKNSNLQRF